MLVELTIGELRVARRSEVAGREVELDCASPLGQIASKARRNVRVEKGIIGIIQFFVNFFIPIYLSTLEIAYLKKTTKEASGWQL